MLELNKVRLQHRKIGLPPTGRGNVSTVARTVSLSEFNIHCIAIILKKKKK